MRVRVGFDFDMPLNWRLNLKQQSVLSSYAFIIVFGGGKYPGDDESVVPELKYTRPLLESAIQKYCRNNVFQLHAKDR